MTEPQSKQETAHAEVLRTLLLDLQQDLDKLQDDVDGHESVWEPGDIMADVARTIMIMSRSPLAPEDNYKWRDLCETLIECARQKDYITAQVRKIAELANSYNP